MSKISLFATAILIASAPAWSGSAQAFSLTKLVHGVAKDVKGAEKAVGHVAASAGRDVGKVAVGAERDVGHVAAGAGRDVGKVAAAGYKEGDKINKSVGKVVGNVSAAALDTTGTVLDRIPVANFAGPVFHDASKAVKSDAAHYGALAAVGLAVGGAAIAGPAVAAAPVGAGTNLGAAAVNGGMAGYYGRQGYLAVRCSPKDTATCKRLKAKP